MRMEPEPVEGKPYNRELLYKNDEVELLVMNWFQLECAPHDHGNSFGWIQVLSGTSRNSVYEVNGNGLPIELFHADHQKETYFYAPKRPSIKRKHLVIQIWPLSIYTPHPLPE
jgi:cysteine dioxygenase